MKKLYIEIEVSEDADINNIQVTEEIYVSGIGKVYKPIEHHEISIPVDDDEINECSPYKSETFETSLWIDGFKECQRLIIEGRL